MRKIWLLIVFLMISISTVAKPSIGLVGDEDFVIAEWFANANVPYLSLSLSDLETSILEKLDLIIINSAPQFTKEQLSDLKRYLRTGGKVCVLAGVLANDLLDGKLIDGSIAFTLGITALTQLDNAYLVLDETTINLPTAYSLTPRRGTELGYYTTGDIGALITNNSLLLGIPSLSEELLGSNALCNFFLSSIKSFLLDESLLDTAKNRLDPQKLSGADLEMYKKANELQKKLKTMSLGEAFDAFDQSLKLYTDSYLKTLPSRTIETRAVWYRPPTNKFSILEDLDTMQKLGINLIFVETWWEGGLLYPNGPVSQRPEFLGWDPLACIITEAHKRDIEVHAWLEVFFSGYKKPGEILTKHPDWAAVGLDGNIPVKAEDDKYFIDPAHKEARAFILGMFVEMVKEYELDGLHLDYIRYPLGAPIPYGFSLNTQELFQKTTGLEFPWSPSHPNWAAFNRFKEEQVTSFVAELREVVLRVRPLEISAAVFPGNDALVNKNQNWSDWIQNNYLDFICLMLYSRNTTTVEYWLQESINQIDNKIPYYPALAAISIPEGELLLEQTLLIQKYYLPGVAFFAWNHFNDELIKYLETGPFREKAKRKQ